QDTTLFAKWTINQYTVSFNSNGGSAVAPVTTNYNTSISAPTPPTRTGYTFNGWFKEAGLMTEWNFATDKVTQDTTLYAKWTINQYLVRFDSNGGRSIAPVIANYNTTISPTSTTRTGYTFNGWYKEVGMNTEWKFATDKVTHDITLYANWTINEYTVSFNSNGGSAIAPVTTNYNTTITAPTPPTRAGYIFKGWYKDAEFKTAWDFSTDKITNNTTLFASWTEIVTPDPEPILYTHSAYINGYPDNTFRPEQKVTRAQMAVMLMKNLGLNDVTEKGEYNDVLETHWAYKEIMLAKQREIMFGIGSSFNPNDYITRAQMATIVYRWLKKECSNNSLAFEQCSTLVQKANTTYSDIKSDNWAAEAILAIKHFKIMEGYPDGSFKPNTHLTRAQAVKVLNRLFKRGPLEGDYNPTFKDVPKNHWAFKEIEEAARDHQYIISSDNKEVFVEE
ncbi:S-layer homology domain-containing protein, partial [Pseudoneobacillus rhizosphaerae]